MQALSRLGVCRVREERLGGENRSACRCSVLQALLGPYTASHSVMSVMILRRIDVYIFFSFKQVGETKIRI